MVKTVYKYEWPIDLPDSAEFNLTEGAKILRCDFQENVPFLWALVNPDAPNEKRYVRMARTGHPIPDDIGEYINTAFLGKLIFHFFEERRSMFTVTQMRRE